MTSTSHSATSASGKARSAIRTTRRSLLRARRSRSHGRIGIDVLYGDHELGQRSITRFAMTPRDEGRWIATVSRHWNVDRADPR